MSGTDEDKMLRLIRLCIGKDKYCCILNVIENLVISETEARSVVKTLEMKGRIKLRGHGRDKCVYLC